MLNKINWLVVSGGPGLSNEYLKNALKDVFFSDKLHYYDLFGSPESTNKNPTIEEMVEQIEITAKKKFGTNFYGLISHSFGSYLTLRLLEKNNNNIEAILMLHPMPLKKSDWQNSLTNIAKKIPPTKLNSISNLSKKIEDGKELFKELYPFYIHEESSSAFPINVEFDVFSCNNISSKVPNYDDHDLVEKCKIPIVRIVGEQDAFYTDKTILKDSTVTIPQCGHYSFFEKKMEFNNALMKADILLCQKMNPTIKKC